MRITKYIVLGAILAMLLPTVTFAHGDDEHRGDDQGLRFGIHHFDRSRTGTITAVGTGSFTLKANDGIVYTVNTTNAKLMGPFGNAIAFASIKVNDKARVKGTMDSANNTTVNATSVVIIPANTRPGKVKGTVTAVSGNTITLQTKNDKTVTVTTDSATTVTKADGTAGTTSNVTVGSTVKVKGLWNMVVNAFNAIKIKLK